MIIYSSLRCMAGFLAHTHIPVRSTPSVPFQIASCVLYLLDIVSNKNYVPKTIKTAYNLERINFVISVYVNLLYEDRIYLWRELACSFGSRLYCLYLPLPLSLARMEAIYGDSTRSYIVFIGLGHAACCPHTTTQVVPKKEEHNLDELFLQNLYTVEITGRTVN